MTERIIKLDYEEAARYCRTARASLRRTAFRTDEISHIDDADAPSWPRLLAIRIKTGSAS